MRSFLICIILPFFLTSSSSSMYVDEPKDYRLLLSKHSNRSSPYVACEGAGLVCRTGNCRDVVYCQSGEELVDIETCPSTQICDNGQCIVPPSKYPPCNPIGDLAFVCSKPGIFPDPADCKKYVICAPDITAPSGFAIFTVDCEGNGDYGYNPKTTYCDKKLINRQCETYPIPLCRTSETLPLTANPTIFYECKYYSSPSVLYPHQKRCDNGLKWTASKPCP